MSLAHWLNESVAAVNSLLHLYLHCCLQDLHVCHTHFYRQITCQHLGINCCIPISQWWLAYKSRLPVSAQVSFKQPVLYWNFQMNWTSVSTHSLFYVIFKMDPLFFKWFGESVLGEQKEEDHVVEMLQLRQSPKLTIYHISDVVGKLANQVIVITSSISSKPYIYMHIYIFRGYEQVSIVCSMCYYCAVGVHPIVDPIIFSSIFP